METDLRTETGLNVRSRPVVMHQGEVEVIRVFNMRNYLYATERWEAHIIAAIT